MPPQSFGFLESSGCDLDSTTATLLEADACLAAAAYSDADEGTVFVPGVFDPGIFE